MKPEELERSFARGQRIIEVGSRERELYVVRSGAVRIDWSDGRPPSLRAEGGLFGELGAIVGDPSPYSATALDEVVVLALDLPRLNRLCSECLEFSLRLIRHLASEYGDALSAALVTGTTGEPGELRKLAAALATRLGKGEPPIQVPGALKDLAQASGLEVLAAYRAIQTLLDRGVVQLIDDQLSVVAPEVLGQLAG